MWIHRLRLLPRYKNLTSYSATGYCEFQVCTFCTFVLEVTGSYFVQSLHCRLGVWDTLQALAWYKKKGNKDTTEVKKGLWDNKMWCRKNCFVKGISWIFSASNVF